MSLDGDVERVLAHLSAEQVRALAASVAPTPPPGAQPAAAAAVVRLAATAQASSGVGWGGVCLALRVGLRARQAAGATRTRPVWTGPNAEGETRLTAGVLHELIAGARHRILITSFSTSTIPAVAEDLADAVRRGCTVDVVFETHVDSAGYYTGADTPFAAVDGIRRWRWPVEHREAGALLHAKLLVTDGQHALIGSANLTSAALTKHLEAGVLIRDPSVAGELEAHVHGLMTAGILVGL